MLCQLDFFDTEKNEKTEIECLKENVQAIKEGNDKVRKSLFARHGELASKYMDLHERMQIIERNICRGEINHPMSLQF